MPSVVETAVDTYIRACCDPDPVVRERLLEACFAEDGRLVTASREIRGRAAVTEMLNRFHANPQMLRIRMASVVDARATIFRFRSVVDMRDGTSSESFDAGEIDATGRIFQILTFAGPLAEVTADPRKP